jgi:hypothetical protein
MIDKEKVDPELQVETLKDLLAETLLGGCFILFLFKRPSVINHDTNPYKTSYEMSNMSKKYAVRTIEAILKCASYQNEIEPHAEVDDLENNLTLTVRDKLKAILEPNWKYILIVLQKDGLGVAIDSSYCNRHLGQYLDGYLKDNRIQ